MDGTVRKIKVSVTATVGTVKIVTIAEYDEELAFEYAWEPSRRKRLAGGLPFAAEECISKTPSRCPG